MDFGLGLVHLAGVAITAGATVGSAAITADAQRSIARSQRAGDLQVALAQERAAIAADQLALETQRVAASQSNKNVAAGALALVAGVLLVGVFFGSGSSR